MNPLVLVTFWLLVPIHRMELHMRMFRAPMSRQSIMSQLIPLTYSRVGIGFLVRAHVPKAES